MRGTEVDVCLSLLLSLTWAGGPSLCDLGAGLWLSGPGPGQVRPAQASSTRARGAHEQPAGGGRETGVVHGGAQLRDEPREPTKPALRSPFFHPQAAGFGRLPVLPLLQVQEESPGAMASPCGSPEDTGKLRGRDGRQRREEEDAPPEEKRLRLGLEGGSAAKEEEDAPRLGREETGTQTGGEDRGVSAGGGGGAAGTGPGGWAECSRRRQVQVDNCAATPSGGRGVTACGDLLRN